MDKQKLDGALVDDTYHLVKRARDLFVFFQRLTTDSRTDDCYEVVDDILRNLAPEYAQEMQRAINEMKENFDLPEVYRPNEVKNC